jgi:hypothetical protein
MVREQGDVPYNIRSKYKNWWLMCSVDLDYVDFLKAGAETGTRSGGATKRH